MTNENELRPEYDGEFWSGAARGKYVAARVVRIAPDVAARFPDDKSINEALRLVIECQRVVGIIPSQEDVGQFFSDSDRIEG